MNSHDKIALEIANLYEKYDFYNNRQYLGDLDELNPWISHSSRMPVDTVPWDLLIRNAWLEVIDNNRDYFDNYVCPIGRLQDILVYKKGLSEEGLEILKGIIKKFLDVQFQHKMFIHKWLNTNVPNIKDIVAKMNEYSVVDEDDESLDFGEVDRLEGGGIEIEFELADEYEETDEDYERWDFYDELQEKVMKSLISDYIKTFKTSMEIDWDYLLKQVRPYAQGNKTYYFDETEDFDNVFDEYKSEVLRLFESPPTKEAENKRKLEEQNRKIKEEIEEEKEKKADIEYLKEKSASLFG